jgi:hypothetical protein
MGATDAGKTASVALERSANAVADVHDVHDVLVHSHFLRFFDFTLQK